MIVGCCLASAVVVAVAFGLHLLHFKFWNCTFERPARAAADHLLTIWDSAAKQVMYFYLSTNTTTFSHSGHAPIDQNRGYLHSHTLHAGKRGEAFRK